MNKAFIFIKFKNKNGIKKVNVPHVKMVSGGFVVKRSYKKPFFVVPELRKEKNERTPIKKL